MTPKGKAMKNDDTGDPVLSATEFAMSGGIPRARHAGFYHTVRVLHGGAEPGSVRKSAAEWTDIFASIDRGERP